MHSHLGHLQRGILAWMKQTVSSRFACLHVLSFSSWKVRLQPHLGHVRLTDESQGEMGDLDLVLNPRLDILQIPLLDIDTQQELEELLG